MFCVCVCFRPVCPSGDGGVLESCCSLSPLDPLPYSTWPFISSASLEGEQETTHHVFTKAWSFTITTIRCSLTLTSVFQGLRGHSALWKDQFRETPGKVRAFLLATHTNWYTEGKSMPNICTF